MEPYPNCSKYFNKDITNEDIIDTESMKLVENLASDLLSAPNFKKKSSATRMSALHKFLSQINHLLSPEELAKSPSAAMERQRLKDMFDEGHLTYLSDKQKISLSTFNAIRQLQREDYRKYGRDQMLFASTFKIKRFRKLMAIAGDALFNPKILPNKVFWQMDLKKTLEQFIRRRYEPTKLNSNEVIKVEICFTYDGTR